MGRAYGVVAGLVALVLLAATGCTDDRSRPSATLPPTSSATPSPTEQPPGPPGYPFPPEALEYTEAGAIAFFNYWIELVNQTAQELNPEPIDYLSDEDCSDCQFLIDLYSEDAAAGVTYEGGDLMVTSPVLPALAPDPQGRETIRVAVSGVGDPLVVLDRNGTPIPDRSYSAQELVITMEAIFISEELSWRVSSFLQQIV